MLDQIARHANWLPPRVSSIYQGEIPEIVLRILAGSSEEEERFWMVRSTVIPPVELQKLIFPVIDTAYPDEDWKIWMEDIMTDKDRVNHQRMDQRFTAKYPEHHDAQKIKFCVLLAHLRKIILQDAAALMEIHSDPQCLYDQHRIFLQPVFKSPLFSQLRADLRGKMATARSPTAHEILGGLRDISEQLNVIAEQEKEQATALRQSELLKASIQRIADRVMAEITTMYNDFMTSCNTGTSYNNTLIHNLNTHAQEMNQSLHHASEATGNTASSTATIPLVHSASDRLTVTSPASESSCSLSLPDEQQRISLALPPQTSSVRTRSPAPAPSSSRSHSTTTSPNSPPPASTPVLSPAASSPPTQLSPALPPAVSPQPAPMKALPETIQPTAMTDLEKLAEQLAWPRDQPALSTYRMRPRPRALEPLWQEWFHGINGAPSIWQMDRFYKWRKNATNAIQKHYGFNRTLIDAILETILITPGDTLEMRKEEALKTIRTRAERAGSLNQYYLQLRKGAATERKPIEREEPQEQGS